MSHRSTPNSDTFLAAAVGAILAAGLMLAAPARSAGIPQQAAHDHGGAQGGHSFGAIDTDHDGRISRTEFAAAHAGASERFGGVDGNGDGFISQQEFDAHHAKMGGGDHEHAQGEHADHH